MTEIAFDLNKIAANLVTEDDEAVDNIFSAKQQRLMVETLYSSWKPPIDENAPIENRKFLADANVGIFYSRHQPPIVPDVFVSLDVEPNAEWFADEHRSYFVWEFDKVPEVAVEIVSNKKGGELTTKMRRYAQMDIAYYVVFDPFRALGEDVLQVYERALWKRYRRREDFSLPEINLGLTLWQGEFEAVAGEWLRWCSPDGQLILTGSEQAKNEIKRANAEAERAARLAAKLRELGVDPETI